MIHITPPQGRPDVIRDSPLADAAGWVNVDKHTLQHPDFSNVFSLGDASSLPTSKTGAAIRKQAPVLVNNLLATARGQSKASFMRYDGYSSCPLVTGYGKLVAGGRGMLKGLDWPPHLSRRATTARQTPPAAA